MDKKNAVYPFVINFGLVGGSVWIVTGYGELVKDPTKEQIAEVQAMVDSKTDIYSRVY